MKARIQNLIRRLFRQLPPIGSTYTHNKKGSPYDGMTGVVGHHYDQKRFYIDCETNTLCNIKPRYQWIDY